MSRGLIHRVLQKVRTRAGLAIRRSAGLAGGPPPRCDDPELAYSEVHGATRLIHGDLPAMLVGGIGSLLLQMLHPYAMAGVADHSKYQDDPFGRLAQTANFISATTYGSKEQARVVIDKVLHVHTFVNGIADDGTPYDANDPHLLLWVHCAEITMFLTGYQRYGAQNVSAEDADSYVREMMPLAEELGVLRPPSNVKELRSALLSFRPELRLTKDAAIARDFIAHSVVKSRQQRILYRLMVLSSWSLLDPWARDLLGVKVNPLFDRMLVRPSMKLLGHVMRLAVPPAPR